MAVKISDLRNVLEATASNKDAADAPVYVVRRGQPEREVKEIVIDGSKITLRY